MRVAEHLDLLGQVLAVSEKVEGEEEGGGGGGEMAPLTKMGKLPGRPLPTFAVFPAALTALQLHTLKKADPSRPAPSPASSVQFIAGPHGGEQPIYPKKDAS